MKHYDVCIIGGGPAGIAAAIWCKRLNLSHILVESKKQLGGQLLSVFNEIIDYPGVIYSNGPELQQNLVHQINALHCNYELSAKVTAVCPSEQKLQLNTKAGRIDITYQFIILATGASPRRINIEGEQELIDQGLLYSASKDGHLFKGKHVAVIGGGDRAFEGALLLANAGAEVSLIHRSDHFKARSEFSNPAKKHPGITLHTHTFVKKIHVSDKVTGIEIEKNGEQKAIDMDAVFIRIGVEPNTHFLREFIEADPEGYIKTNKYNQTTTANIYAIGDTSIHPQFSSISLSVGQAMVSAKHISIIRK